jgi:hypothetical protein
MKLFFVFGFLLLTLITDGQKLLKGIVLDQSKKKPVIKALVFLNGTTIGTSTNEQGGFALNIPNGRHTLVISSVGFETQNQIINTDNFSDSITINLEISQSQKIPADHYGKNAFENWINFFLINFIGTSINAQDCKIKNTKSIHFLASEEDDELSAFADEPLVIENKALGYTILYKLESFNCNFKAQSLSYMGYAFFQPMNGNTDKQKKWEKRRSETYFGSMMHFMRSVYLNKIVEEGFEVRALRKIRNIPGYPPNQVQSNDLHSVKTTDSSKTFAPDSSFVDDYRDQIANADNYKDVIGTTLSGDSIARESDGNTAVLDFTNFLLIIYRGRKGSFEFDQQYNEVDMTSQLILLNRKTVEIEADGSYYDPRNLMILGYWASSEKIANVLPFDYQPSKQ